LHTAVSGTEYLLSGVLVIEEKILESGVLLWGSTLLIVSDVPFRGTQAEVIGC